MERKNLIILLLLTILSLFNCQVSLSQSRDSLFFKWYTTTNMEPWKATMEQMNTERTPGNYKELFEVVLAWYGYIGYCLGNNKEDEAEQYLETGWEYLDELIEMNPSKAAPHALRSGFYGFEMALARYKALILGPRSVFTLKTAASIDSSNIHYLVEKGNQMYYMPSMLGGDKQVALHHYKHAVELMESGSKYHQGHWFYLNTLVTLGYSYQSTEHIKEARDIYQKIQRIAPNFKWFNQEVWPKFVKKYGAS